MLPLSAVSQANYSSEIAALCTNFVVPTLSVISVAFNMFTRTFLIGSSPHSLGCEGAKLVKRAFPPGFGRGKSPNQGEINSL